MYCPRCGTEYRPGIGHCSDCDSLLDQCPVTAGDRQGKKPVWEVPIWPPYPLRKKSLHEDVREDTPPRRGSSSYAEQWDRYRRLRRELHIAFIACVLALLWTVASDLHWGRGYSTRNGFGALAVTLGACFGVATVRAVLWPCPGCGTRNSFRRRGTNIPARKCSRCGLGKYATETSEGSGSSAEPRPRPDGAPESEPGVR
jgi:hypothetical protein